MNAPPFFYELQDRSPTEALELALGLIGSSHVFTEGGIERQRDNVVSDASVFQSESSVLTLILASSSPLKAGVLMRVGRIGGATNITLQPWSTFDFTRWTINQLAELTKLAESSRLSISLAMFNERGKELIRSAFQKVASCEIFE